MKKSILFLSFLTAIILSTSCKKDDDNDVEEVPMGICEMTIVSDWYGSFSGGCQGEDVNVVISQSSNPENFVVEVEDVGEGTIEFEATIITEIGCRAKILTYPFINEEMILKDNKNEIVFDFLMHPVEGIPCSFLKVNRD